MKKYTLVVFYFLTGDDKSPITAEERVVENSQYADDVIENAIISFYETTESDYMLFDEIIDHVLTTLGWEWHMLDKAYNISSISYLSV